MSIAVAGAAAVTVAVVVLIVTRSPAPTCARVASHMFPLQVEYSKSTDPSEGLIRQQCVDDAWGERFREHVLAAESWRRVQLVMSCFHKETGAKNMSPSAGWGGGPEECARELGSAWVD